jgi:hypothetical protein
MDAYKKAKEIWKRDWVPVCDAISNASYDSTGVHPDTQSLLCLAAAVHFDALSRGYRLVVDPVTKKLVEEKI